MPTDKVAATIQAASMVQSGNVFKLVRDLNYLTDAIEQTMMEMKEVLSREQVSEGNGQNISRIERKEISLNTIRNIPLTPLQQQILEKTRSQNNRKNP